MATYLFAWNPRYWNWPELGATIRRCRRRGFVDVEWASGRARAIEPGSRAFMVRVGGEPRGIFGSGVTLTAPGAGRHWVEAKAAAGIPALYLKLRLETLAVAPIVGFEELTRPPFSRFRWGVRASGTRVPEPIADAFEELWAAHIPGR